jgi:cellulose synthase operon protein B
MERLFRLFQSMSAKRGQRHSSPRSSRLLLPLLLLCGVLVLTLGIRATVVVAQSDSSIKQEEDKLIRQYTLPSAPTKPPVYKPIPASPSRRESPPRSRKQSAPPPQRESAPAPPPRRRQTVAPEPESAPPPREAPRPVRRSAPAPVRRSAPPPESSDRPIIRDDVPDSELIESEPIESEPIESEIETTQTQESPVSSTQSNTDALTQNLPASKYALEFNRSPVVGNRFRLQGVYSEARLGFTRPHDWKVKSVKALVRYQHSPALLANRSNLTVRVNDRSIGSVPLNRKESEIGSMMFNIPPNLIQDYNDISMVVQQNNDAKCSDPSDPTLWTEILPDSKLLFDYQLQPVSLSFNRYPYPFFDELSLEPNRIAYLLPTVTQTWLSSASRIQAALGRLADFRPMETRLVQDLDEVEANERVVVVGTPADQSTLKSLDLPFKISQNQILDGSKNPLPEDVGLLMLTTTQKGSVPVLVVTGNGPQGVAKAAQFLVEPDTRKLGTGQAIIVSDIKPVPTPSPRTWPRYLPEQNSFKLSDLKTPLDGKSFQDITVRGSSPAPIEFDFRALPDDDFTRGSYMNLRYSYGPQVNPRLSAVEVLLNDVFIGGARLTSEEGANRKTLKVDLPANLLDPTSKIKVAFRLNPKEAPQCGKITDQQLTGTLHADTNFKLNRETSVKLPDLKLLRSGFPLSAPQDLSNTAIVIPTSPSTTDLLTLLTVSERLGRLSQADSINLDAYTLDALPSNISKSHHLVGIGIREKFPFPKVFESGGFRLSDAFSRQTSQGSIQTLPDTEGVIKEVLSPENSDRVLLALSAQTEDGLERVRQVIGKDNWFLQLQKDTVLVSSDSANPPEYDPNAYKLEFLESAPSSKRIGNATLLSKISRFLQENWFLLPLGIVAIALLLYGVAQLYLKRVTDKKRAEF